jgi:hypothetical protein
MFKILVFLTFVCTIFDVNAQMLSAGDVDKTRVFETKKEDVVKGSVKEETENTGLTLEELTRQNASSNNDMAQALSDAVVSTESFDKKVVEKSENAPVEEDIFIPEGELSKLHKLPTIDGSQRGGQAFVAVDEKGRMKRVDKIFLYYDEFKITNYISNTATCDVRFNILSNLDRRISQLDVKLVWPDMTTTLSFSDVNPNTQTYYNYALIGNGCYNMDIAPNIIVNRCRVKGMTASECANKLIWLSK